MNRIDHLVGQCIRHFVNFRQCAVFAPYKQQKTWHPSPPAFMRGKSTRLLGALCSSRILNPGLIICIGVSQCVSTVRHLAWMRCTFFFQIFRFFPPEVKLISTPEIRQRRTGFYFSLFVQVVSIEHPNVEKNRKKTVFIEWHTSSPSKKAGRFIEKKFKIGYILPIFGSVI